MCGNLKKHEWSNWWIVEQFKRKKEDVRSCHRRGCFNARTTINFNIRTSLPVANEHYLWSQPTSSIAIQKTITRQGAWKKGKCMEGQVGGGQIQMWQGLVTARACGVTVWHPSGYVYTPDARSQIRKTPPENIFTQCTLDTRQQTKPFCDRWAAAGFLGVL